MCVRARSGELYPVETDVRLCDVLTTGCEVTVDMEADVLTDHSTGNTYKLKSIGDVSGGGGGAGGDGGWMDGCMGRGRARHLAMAVVR